MKAIAICLALLAVFGIMAVPFLFGPTDDQMIRDALKESIKASREGRPGGVMEYLSNSLKYNDEEATDRTSIADYIKRAKPEVSVDDPTPRISGESAMVVSPVTVNLTYGPVSFPVRIEHAEITFAKETGRRFLVLPAPVWRIRSIKADEVDVSQLMK